MHISINTSWWIIPSNFKPCLAFQIVIFWAKSLTYATLNIGTKSSLNCFCIIIMIHNKYRIAYLSPINKALYFFLNISYSNIIFSYENLIPPRIVYGIFNNLSSAICKHFPTRIPPRSLLNNSKCWASFRFINFKLV